MGRRLPALMKLYEKYRAHRDKFEIFAFHSPSAATFAELDEKMKGIIKNQWNGKDIPFPSLLDATGQTLKNFSVRALGTHALINPEGKLVKGDGERTLEEALKGLIQKRDQKPR
ncbi:MAG: TlpA family protein disulfide reductase [Planctomycetota bacterium]